MAGRPTIPAAVKKARGNPGRRPIPKEPKADRVQPRMPKFKNASTRTRWKRDTAAFYAAGLITELSVDAWLDYFMLVDRRASLERERSKVKRQGGNWLAIERLIQKLNDQIRAARQGFGGDPSSLSKVFSARKEEEQNPFATFELVQGGK